MSFIVRKIDQSGASFGEKLKALRHDRGYNIEQVCKATNLHRSLIQSLEENDFANLPESIYTRNFLKTYIKFLQGDEAYFLDCYQQARGTCDFVDPLLLPRKKVRRARFLVSPRIFKFVSLAAAACLVLVYLGMEVRDILVPPQIELSMPSDGFATTSPIIKVSGSVAEQSEVSVNGEKVLLNKDGSFNTDVDLEKGLNLITIEAKKRYSKTFTVYRRVLLEPNSKELSVIY